MQPCTKAKLFTYSLRFLAVALTGILAWYFAEPVAAKFGHELTDGWQMGIGAIAGLVALIISNRALDFTEDCMTIPDAGDQHLAAAGSSCSREGCRRYVAPPVSGQPARKPCKKKEAGASKADSAESFQLGTVIENQTMTVVLEQAQAGPLNLSVTVKGLTASQFKGNNGLRGRLEAVGGISWENPRNLGDGRREMRGAIQSDSDRQRIVGRLKEIASRYA
ncbi:MAG: hypothetical protein AB7W16_12720 [Candidatus Obscuribacterales bacterium]